MHLYSFKKKLKVGELNLLELLNESQTGVFIQRKLVLILFHEPSQSPIHHLHFDIIGDPSQKGINVMCILRYSHIMAD